MMNIYMEYSEHIYGILVTFIYHENIVAYLASASVTSSRTVAHQIIPKWGREATHRWSRIALQHGKPTVAGKSHRSVGR